mgnify:CR=1 FL=1
MKQEDGFFIKAWRVHNTNYAVIIELKNIISITAEFEDDYYRAFIRYFGGGVDEISMNEEIFKELNRMWIDYKKENRQ